MDRLTELLSTEVDLEALSQEELEARRTDLTDAVRAAREGEMNAEVLELMKRGTVAAKEAQGVIDARAEEAARIIREADETLAELGGDDPEDEEGDEGDEDDAPAEEPAPAETPAEEPAEEPAPAEAAAEPIAAGAKRAPVKNVVIPARSRPRPPSRGGPVMVASGEVRGIQSGHAFADIDAMHHAMYEKWDSMRHTGDGLPHHVATIDYRSLYGPERTISGGDPFDVSTQLMRVVDDYKDKLRERSAMVASGGIPGPPEARYEVITYGQTVRPVRDGLPSVLMKRGTTTFNMSPVLAAIVQDTALGAIGTVTAAQDLAGATKNVQEIAAPVAVTAIVEAETMRFSQGNFADHFLPEWTAAVMKLGQVAFARHNDALRLADIKAGCTKYTDTPAKFGAYRDLKRQFFGEIERIADLIRDYSTPITVIFPEFVPAMLATDLVAQAPGDEAWKITEDVVRRDVESWDPQVNVIWAYDSIRGPLSTAPTGQSPRTPGFDADVEWAMFPTGAFVYGDGGQLDLGILRDTVVSATNKFQTFFEQWECLLQLIPTTHCFWNTSALCASGVSQASAAVTGVCEPGGS